LPARFKGVVALQKLNKTRAEMLRFLTRDLLVRAKGEEREVCARYSFEAVEQSAYCNDPVGRPSRAE
jgi:hypothetical protein